MWKTILDLSLHQKFSYLAKKSKLNMRIWCGDLFFPINCLGCGQEGKFICPSCFEKIPLNKKPPSKKLIVASHYQHPLVKKAIHQYKYNFIKDLAVPLAKLMIQKLSFCPEIPKKNVVLIPVPLHQRRLRWRGFNQAELLAREISQVLKIPLVNDILIRKKHTLPQAKMPNLSARKQNIQQTFALKSSKRLVIKNDVPPQFLRRASFSGRASGFETKTIILVDDVATTGATIKECAKILKPLKPKQIWGLVVARG